MTHSPSWMAEAWTHSFNNSIAKTLLPQEQVDKIEAVQQWAVRFIKGDYKWNSSVFEMQQSLSLEQLSDRRRVHGLKTFYLAECGSIACLYLIIINALHA